MVFKYIFYIWALFMGLENAFSQGTQGVPIPLDRKQSSISLPTNEDWAILVKVARITEFPELETTYVYGVKVWDDSQSPTELTAKLIGSGKIEVGTRIKFFRVPADTSGVQFICFAPKSLLIIEDLGNGTGRPCQVDKNGNFSADTGSAVLPMKPLDPLTQFHDGNPPFRRDRKYFGQRVGNIYLVWLPGFGDYAKTIEKKFVISDGSIQSAEMALDGQGNVLDFQSGCQFGEWELLQALQTGLYQDIFSLNKNLAIGRIKTALAVYFQGATGGSSGIIRPIHWQWYNGLDWIVGAEDLAQGMRKNYGDYLLTDQITKSGKAYFLYINTYLSFGLPLTKKYFIREYTEQTNTWSPLQLLVSKRDNTAASVSDYLESPKLSQNEKFVILAWQDRDIEYNSANQYSIRCQIKRFGGQWQIPMWILEQGSYSSFTLWSLQSCEVCAFAVYSATSGSTTSYYARRYDYDQNVWETPENFFSTTGTPVEIFSAVNSLGHCILNYKDTTQKTRFWNGTIWEAEHDLSTTKTVAAISLARETDVGLILMFNPGGNLLTRTWDGTSWGSDTQIPNSLSATSGVWPPSLVMDKRERGIAVWRKIASSNRQIWTSRYKAGTWEAATLLSESTGNFQDPFLGLNDKCFAACIYEKYVSSSGYLYANIMKMED